MTADAQCLQRAVDWRNACYRKEEHTHADAQVVATWLPTGATAIATSTENTCAIDFQGPENCPESPTTNDYIETHMTAEAQCLQRAVDWRNACYRKEEHTHADAQVVATWLPTGATAIATSIENTCSIDFHGSTTCSWANDRFLETHMNNEASCLQRAAAWLPHCPGQVTATWLPTGVSASTPYICPVPATGNNNDCCIDYQGPENCPESPALNDYIETHTTAEAQCLQRAADWRNVCYRYRKEEHTHADAQVVATWLPTGATAIAKSTENTCAIDFQGPENCPEASLAELIPLRGAVSKINGAGRPVEGPAPHQTAVLGCFRSQSGTIKKVRHRRTARRVFA
jgi:hypothetical protein